MAELGYREEHRRFQTHLTIGRVRGGGPGIAELGHSSSAGRLRGRPHDRQEGDRLLQHTHVHRSDLRSLGTAAARQNLGFAGKARVVAAVILSVAKNLRKIGEILRFAQDDDRFAQDDGRFAQDDGRFAQDGDRFAQDDGRSRREMVIDGVCVPPRRREPPGV